MKGLGYAFLCVALPAAWGWLMFHAFNLWERRKAKKALPPIDYSI